MTGKWELQECPNSLGSEWKVIAEFHCQVEKLEPAGDRLLVTLLDGSVWSLSQDGQKVMLSGAGRWIQ